MRSNDSCYRRPRSLPVQGSTWWWSGSFRKSAPEVSASPWQEILCLILPHQNHRHNFAVWIIRDQRDFLIYDSFFHFSSLTSYFPLTSNPQPQPTQHLIRQPNPITFSPQMRFDMLPPSDCPPDRSQSCRKPKSAWNQGFPSLLCVSPWHQYYRLHMLIIVQTSLHIISNIYKF